MCSSASATRCFSSSATAAVRSWVINVIEGLGTAPGPRRRTCVGHKHTQAGCRHRTRAAAGPPAHTHGGADLVPTGQHVVRELLGQGHDVIMGPGGGKRLLLTLALGLQLRWADHYGRGGGGTRPAGATAGSARRHRHVGAHTTRSKARAHSSSSPFTRAARRAGLASGQPPTTRMTAMSSWTSRYEYCRGGGRCAQCGRAVARAGEGGYLALF